VIRDLRAAQHEFARQPSARIIGAAIGYGMLARSRVGRPQRADLAAIAVVGALRPFVEWGLHRYALHAEPKQLAGLRIDTSADHVFHHEEPNDLSRVLLGTKWAITHTAMLALVVGGTAHATTTHLTTRLTTPLGGNPAASRAATRTAIVAAHSSLFVYEWIHFLVHTSYRPRSARLTRLRHAHRRHHWHNAAADFGITSTIADRLLGTSSRDYTRRVSARVNFSSAP
jgi:hypothetical protein